MAEQKEPGKDSPISNEEHKDQMPKEGGKLPLIDNPKGDVGSIGNNTKPFKLG